MSSGLVGSSIHQGSNCAKGAHRGDRLVDAPDLVRVHHQLPAGAEHLPDRRCPPDVRLDVAADLHLHVLEAVRDRLGDERLHLLVLVADPAGGRGVGGVAVGDDLRLPLLLARCRRAQEVERLLGREGVLDVAEVDRSDEVFGRQSREELPERHARLFRPEIPDGVDDRAHGEMDDALLRSEPAELVVRHERAPEAAHVSRDPVERATGDERLECAHGGDTDLGSSPVREGQAMSARAGFGVEDDVGRRVVGLPVHGVGAVERPGGREADVMGAEACDPHARTAAV